MFNKKLPIPTVRELLRSVRTIRKDWNEKTPLQKWSYLYGIGRALCVVVQVPLYKDDQTLSWLAYQGCLYFGIYFILGVYTIYYYWMIGEVARSLPCTCILVGPILGVSVE